MPPDLTVQLGPVALRNPVICGSGEHVNTAAALRQAIDAGASAVVAKSANESDAARRQSDGAAWAFVDDARHVVEGASAGRASMLNRSGLVQTPWTQWLSVLAEADRYAAGRGSWVVASIIPGQTDALPGLVADVQAAGLRWVELNLSAPHSGEAAVSDAIERAHDGGRAAQLTRLAREASSLPLSVKLPAEHHDVVSLADAVRRAGADVVVMMGRHMGFLPDLETRRPVLESFGGYSGPWSLPLSLRWIAKTRRALGPELPLVGTNGARDGGDVARFLLAGASAVQVASSVIAEGFGALERMVLELSAYLSAQGCDARDLVGEAADHAITYEEAAMRRRSE